MEWMELDPDYKEPEEDLSHCYVTKEQAASGEYPCVCHNASSATFWLKIEKDPAYDDVEIDYLGGFPFPYPDEKALEGNIYPEHRILFEVHESGMGFPSLFGFDEDEVEDWMKEHNIVSGQPFKVWMQVDYVKVGWEYEEWEMQCEWEILDRKEIKK